MLLFWKSHWMLQIWPQRNSCCFHDGHAEDRRVRYSLVRLQRVCYYNIWTNMTPEVLTRLGDLECLRIRSFYHHCAENTNINTRRTKTYCKQTAGSKGPKHQSSGIKLEHKMLLNLCIVALELSQNFKCVSISWYIDQVTQKFWIWTDRQISEQFSLIKLRVIFSLRSRSSTEPGSERSWTTTI